LGREYTYLERHAEGCCVVQVAAVNEVTLILNALEQGNNHAVDQLLPVVYQELRQLAAHKIAQERPGQTLQATALVHEAYLRLVEPKAQGFGSRAHFFGAAAEAMRRILIENARHKLRIKRGGDLHKVELNTDEVVVEETSLDLIALDEALTELWEKDRTKAELVKLRYFAGLTLEEAAQVLDMSATTASRHWNYARAWLYGRIHPDD
jgi:RNA polymerase sigma factor (TIGR02999 family)